MLVKVTQEHIDNGVRRKCSRCPIALALHEHSSFALVGLGVAEVDSGFYTLPMEAAKFEVDFDNGFPVQPFTFELAND